MRTTEIIRPKKKGSIVNNPPHNPRLVKYISPFFGRTAVIRREGGGGWPRVHQPSDSKAPFTRGRPDILLGGWRAAPCSENGL